MEPQTIPRATQMDQNAARKRDLNLGAISRPIFTIFRPQKEPKMAPKIAQKPASAPQGRPRAAQRPPGSHFGPEDLVKYVFLAPGSFENHVNYEVLARGSLEHHVNAWVPLKPRKLRGCSAWEPLKPRKTRGHAPSELSTKLTQSLVKRSFETAARQMRKAMWAQWRSAHWRSGH